MCGCRKAGMKCSAVCFHCSGETCSNVMELSELINENDFDDEPPTLTPSFSSSPTARRTAELEVAEKRMYKITQANLDSILVMEKKMDEVMADVSSMRNFLGYIDVPENFEDPKGGGGKTSSAFPQLCRSGSKGKTFGSCRKNCCSWSLT
ncbi:hypothetical protein EVAR_6559_1 [Eumeta japonica]|uniref:Uncharacterized protein n=1 Tax=Eumeta variegata TaxID=151549 RepID=A0A4C1SQ56_EUMVA|nr:hypothetical protein EVAR_6559_1 [Eumeta japonica]